MMDQKKSHEWCRKMPILEENVVKFLSLPDFSKSRAQFFAT